MLNDPELKSLVTHQGPASESLDPFKPQAWFVESERSASGAIVDSLCILLTGKECPWRCVMCDLWKHTLAYPTPARAIPRQIESVLSQVPRSPQEVKLYNSGSFFDVAAVPPQDYKRIADQLSFAQKVIVESHPRLVGQRTLEFRALLIGDLEVALGLETAEPEVLLRLNKRFDLAQFDRSATFLSGHGISLRAFLLVQPPFTSPDEAVPAALKSAQFAFKCGASAVSLIPTRPGNEALAQLAQRGNFIPPTLATLEGAFEAVLRLRAGRAFADLWDLEKFAACQACFASRRDRLQQMNLSQSIFPRITCRHCSEAAGEDGNDAR